MSTVSLNPLLSPVPGWNPGFLYTGQALQPTWLRSIRPLQLALIMFILPADFDFSVPGSMKLHNLISKLKKWIKILEAKTKQLPKFFLIEEKCRFLSNFSAQTAEVEIPGEFLMPKPTHYYIKIAR